MTEEQQQRESQPGAVRGYESVAFNCPKCGSAAVEPLSSFKEASGGVRGGVVLFCLCGTAVIVRCDDNRWSVKVHVEATEARVAQRVAGVLTS